MTETAPTTYATIRSALSPQTYLGPEWHHGLAYAIPQPKQRYPVFDTHARRVGIVVPDAAEDFEDYVYVARDYVVLESVENDVESVSNPFPRDEREKLIRQLNRIIKKLEDDTLWN